MSATYEAWALGVADDPGTIALVDELPPAKRQPNLVFSAARFLGAAVGAVRVVPRLAARALARGAGHRPVARHPDQRGRPLRAARSGARRHRRAARAARGRGIRRVSACTPTATATGIRGIRSSIRPTGRARSCSTARSTGRCPCPTACPRSSGAPASTSTRSTSRAPTTSPGSTRSSGPSTTTGAPGCRRPRAIAAADPPRIVAGDLNERLAALAAEAPADATLVVFHTAVLAYLDDGGTRAVRRHRARPARPLALGRGRARSSPASACATDVENDSTDFVLALDGVQLAWAQPHGRALTWVPNP